MSALVTFLPEVRPWAPGVPDQVAYKALRNAAVELCERTRMWKWETTVPVLAAEPATRDVPLPNDADVFDFEVALWDGHEISPASTRELDETAAGWRTDLLGPGQPRYITQIEPDTLRLVPAPMQNGTLYLCLRLKPSQSAATLPDFLDKYAGMLGWGALGRLLMTPGQSYTSPELAMAYTARFTQRLDAMFRTGTIGQQNARLRTKSSFY